MGGPRFTGNKDPSGVGVPRFAPPHMEGPVNHGEWVLVMLKVK